MRDVKALRAFFNERLLSQGELAMSSGKQKRIWSPMGCEGHKYPFKIAHLQFHFSVKNESSRSRQLFQQQLCANIMSLLSYLAIYLSTYIPTHLPTYLPTYPPTLLPSYPPRAHLYELMSLYDPTHLPIYQTSYLGSNLINKFPKRWSKHYRYLLFIRKVLK